MMIISLNRTLRRTLTVVSTATAMVLALALPAAAHEPVMLDNTDVIPWKAPLALNSDDPLSFFGVLPEPGAVRSFQLTSSGATPVHVSVFVPDLAPENTLATARLPQVAVIAPDHQVTVIKPTMRVVVPIDEIDETYLLIADYNAPSAKTGIYSFLVTGTAPARFNVSTGIEDSGFHGLERGEVGTIDQIADWYATAP
jgi:hypothetical protein